MRAHVIYDQQGNIISAGHIDESGPEAYDFSAPRFGPLPQPGQTAAVLEVPEEYAKRDFAQVMQRMRVEVEAKQHALVPKKE